VVPPKKRKTPHARRSKRATSPSIINGDEWAMLEREEEEQPLRHGKGPANRFEGEDSPFDEFEVDYSDDEYKEEGVHPISLENHPKTNYYWENTKKYREACQEKHYQWESDTLSAYFHSQVQYRLFWGEFVSKSMQESQWIN
jgi:hypothetical protein